MAPVQIAERRISNVVIFTVSGHLVADEGDLELRDRVAAAMVAGATGVLLDLHDVGYMDSGGAGALAASLFHVARRGGALKLLQPSERVCRVLDSTHMIKVFDVFADEA